jgi:nucleoside-diphosphate-sugar epimerase
MSAFALGHVAAFSQDPPVPLVTTSLTIDLAGPAAQGDTVIVTVDDAAAATVLAAEGSQAGIYNVVDDTPLPVAKWLPAYAEAIGAKSPRRVPKWLARLTVGPIPIHFSTTLDGATNLKARKALGWKPNYPDPRRGFDKSVRRPSKTGGIP